MVNTNRYFASSCPQLDGAVVFQARALYESLNGNDFILEGECIGQAGNTGAKIAQKSNEVKEDLNNLFVYPNPVKDKLFISSNNFANTTISLIDQQGRDLDFPRIIVSDNVLSIDTKNLNRGIYILKITRNFESSTKKIILE